eukprot:1411832-Rhodomonas_salina.2
MSAPEQVRNQRGKTRNRRTFCTRDAVSACKSVPDVTHGSTITYVSTAHGIGQYHACHVSTGHDIGSHHIQDPYQTSR